MGDTTTDNGTAAQAFIARWSGKAVNELCALLGVVPPTNELEYMSLPSATASVAMQAWPATLSEQVRAVAEVLASANAALPLEALEARFKSRDAWKKSLPRILETLEALGRARREGDAWRS